MRIGIIGLPGAGRRTVFEAITRGASDSAGKNGARVASVHVADERVDRLCSMYNPKKTTYAKVEYLLPARPLEGDTNALRAMWNEVRDCDALLQVAGNFADNGTPADPAAELRAISDEMVFADFQVLEKRLDRLEKDARKNRDTDPREFELIRRGLTLLENDRPLREDPEVAVSPLLKGYGLLSARPLLLLVNNPDEDETMPGAIKPSSGVESMVVRGRIECELAQMEEEEAAEFMAEFGVGESALSRVIALSYGVLGLIGFFTVGEDEVKAWTIRRGTCALDAADVIHSDIKKGFIRAEVVSYEDLVGLGGHKEAKAAGRVRLEAKTYEVRDGDVINFRFNV